MKNPIEEYFEKLRMDVKHHLGLGDIRLTIAQQGDISKKYDELLDRFKLALNYALHEIESNPEDSLKDIVNDAFLNCNIPLVSNKDYIIDDFDWDDAVNNAGGLK